MKKNRKYRVAMEIWRENWDKSEECKGSLFIDVEASCNSQAMTKAMRKAFEGEAKSPFTWIKNPRVELLR